MSYWQTLALAAQDAQRGGEAYGQGMDLALKRNNEEMAAKEKMMELALKDAFYERRQKAMNLDLLSKIPALNQQMIDEETRSAMSPYGSIRGITGPSELNLRGQNLQIMPNQPPGMDFGSMIQGAGAAADGFKSRTNPYAPPPMTPQEQSIDRLRKMGDRAPQSEGSIVQPLEGDPRINNALNYVADGESKNFSPLKNEKLQQKMFDAMARTGYADPLMDPRFIGDAMNSMAFTGQVPGMAVQTEKTFDALKGIRDAGFVAAKSSASMNQQAGEVQAKIQQRQLEIEVDYLTKREKLAAEAGDANASNELKAKIETLNGTLEILKSMTRPQPKRGGAAQEDPNKKDYRNRLKEFEQKNTGAMRDAAKKFAMLKPEQLERIIRTNPKAYGPVAAEAWAFYQEGLNNNWTDVLSKDRQVRRMFEGGNTIGGRIGGSEATVNKFQDVLNKRKAPKEGSTPRG